MARSCLFLAVVMVIVGADSHVTAQPKKTVITSQPKKGPDEILALNLQITEKSPKDRAGGNYAMSVPVTFVKDKTYQIDMNGHSLGMLRLEDTKRKVLESDFNGAGSDRPRIVYQAKSTGRFWIICTSRHSRPETGRFTLRVKEVTSDPKELAKPIELKLDKGQASVDAEVEVRGPRYQKNPCKFLTVAMEAGKTYQIDMTSREFLPYVFLEGPDGKLLTEVKIKSGDKQPARITHKAEKAGTYRIIAAQNDWRTGGPQFSLSVREVK